MNREIEKKYLPLIFAEMYLITSVILLKMGPIDWKIMNGDIWIYLIFYHISFAFGYLICACKKRKNDNTMKYTLHFFKHTFWLWWCISFVVSWGVFMGVSQGFVTLKNFFPSFINGIIHPDVQYYEKFKMVYSGNNFLSSISVLFGLSRIMVYFYCVRYWQNISFFKRMALVILATFELMQSVSLGMNKNMIMIDVLLGIMTFIAIFADERSLKESIKSRKGMIIVLVVMAILSILYFGHSTNARINGNVEKYADIMLQDAEIKTIEKGNSSSIDETNDTLDTDHKTSYAKKFFIMGTSYLCQGYKGMDMALSSSFDFGYGLGHSLFLSRIADEFLNTDIIALTYNMKNELKYGWSRESCWNSFYVWMANDVTFIGVIVIMFLYGILLAATWIDTTVKDNFFAGVLFVLLCCEIMWIPMHNFLGAFIEYVGAFWLALFFYLFSKTSIYSH